MPSMNPDAPDRLHVQNAVRCNDKEKSFVQMMRLTGGKNLSAILFRRISRVISPLSSRLGIEKLASVEFQHIQRFLVV